MKKIFIVIIAIFVGLNVAYAVPAYPKPIVVSQPDGTQLTIRMHGDEYLHWTTCGNSLVAKGSDGYWRYASFNADGSMKAEGARVRSTSSGDGSNVTLPTNLVQKAVQMRQRNEFRADGGQGKISLGDKRFLILLIEFSDKSFTQPKNSFTDLLSSADYTYNGATGSVNRYYQDVSFGQFNPQYDVYGPIKVSYTSAECAIDDVYAVMEACRIAHDSLDVNFSNYCIENPSLVDNVFFFFPGYNQAEGGGDDTIWPHAVTYSEPFIYLDGVGIYRYGCASEFKESSGGVMAGIGTFSHEFGHVIGLPDFYDVDYSENGYAKALEKLSLMSSGSYNNEGMTPPYFTYEERHILGWDKGLTLLSTGANTLEKVSTNTSYWSPTATEGEYYLYENRPCEGWDKYTYAPGLVIYHIDKSDYVMPSGYTAAVHWKYGYMLNAYADHQCMDVIETAYPENNVKYYQQFAFPGYDKVTEFTSGTLPAAKSWADVPTGYDLHNIAFNNNTGVTSFTVSKELGLKGRVTTVSGEALPGIEIIVRQVSEQNSAAKSSSVSGVRPMFSPAASVGDNQYRVVSDSQGEFTLSLDTEGFYSVSASREGYVDYADIVEVTGIVGINIIMLTPVDDVSAYLKKFHDLNIGVKAYGWGPGNSCEAAIAFYPEELGMYAGMNISEISFVAYNGGSGTYDKVGVRVYFGDKLMCDKQVDNPLFGTVTTVDISEFGLNIPQDTTVFFSYYVINPSFKWSLGVTDTEDTVVDGGDLRRYLESSEIIPDQWYSSGYGNNIIYARLVDGFMLFDAAGFNYITKGSSYRAGTNYTPELVVNSASKPSSITWTMDGESIPGSVVLTSGIHTVRADVTYSSGRTEIIETKIKVQ